jgi:hypothetical protein
VVWFLGGNALYVNGVRTQTKITIDLSSDPASVTSDPSAPGILLPKEAVQAAAQQIVDNYILPGLRQDIAQLTYWANNYPDATSSQAYRDLSDKVQTELGYFRLCATDSQWNQYTSSWSLLSDPRFSSFTKVATAYQFGVQDLVQNFGFLSGADAQTVKRMQSQYPELYHALAKSGFKDYSAALDGAVYLNASRTLGGEAQRLAFNLATRDIATEQTWLNTKFMWNMQAGPDGLSAGTPRSMMLEFINAEIVPQLANPDAYNKQLAADTGAKFWETSLLKAMYDDYRNYPLLRDFSWMRENYLPVINPGDNSVQKVTFDHWVSKTIADPFTGMATTIFVQEPITCAHFIDARSGNDVYIRPDGSAFIGAGEYIGVVLDATVVADLVGVAWKGGTRVVGIAADTLANVSTRTVAREGVDAAVNEATRVASNPVTKGAGGLLDEASTWNPCIRCFGEGTLVKTEAGYAPIETLKAGDLVQSEDPKTGAIALRRVAQVHIRPAASIKTFYKLTVVSVV